MKMKVMKMLMIMILIVMIFAELPLIGLFPLSNPLGESHSKIKIAAPDA